MQLFMPELISSSNHCPNLGTLHQKTHDTPPSPIHQRLILRLVVTTTAATPTPVTSSPSTAAAIIAAAVTAAATAPSSGVTRCTTGEACILQANTSMAGRTAEQCGTWRLKNQLARNPSVHIS